jgi:hypothetical protein
MVKKIYRKAHFGFVEGKTLRLSFKFLMVFLTAFFAIGLYLFGFTYNITCFRCGGTGKVWENWYDFDVGTWVQGYRECGTCGGTGKVWVYSFITIALISSFAYISCFLMIFALNYAVTSIQLGRNPWVKDIKEMHFWFNPVYLTWLFHTDRRKWLKWTTTLALIATIMIILNFGLILAPTSPTIVLWLRMENQNLLAGLLTGAAFVTLFSITWYQDYEKLSRLGGERHPEAFLKNA